MKIGDKVVINRSKESKFDGRVGRVDKLTRHGKNPYVLFDGDKQHYWFHSSQVSIVSQESGMTKRQLMWFVATDTHGLLRDDESKWFYQIKRLYYKIVLMFGGKK